MKTMLGSRRHHYLTRAMGLLIIAALIAGTVACGGGNGQPAPTTYNLNITSTAGGSVITPGEDIFSYAAETLVNLVAVPDEGYAFMRWTGHVGTIADVKAASTTITVNGNYAITASFEAVPSVRYELNISSTAGGSVTTPGEGTFTYDEGTVVDLTAEAEEGYQFSGWTGDVGAIANANAASTTITMNGDYTISANFEEKLSVEPMVAAGGLHTVGLKSNGRVAAVGDNDAGQCHVSGWTNIIQVAAGGEHTVGLKSDGTAVAVGWKGMGQCDVSGWADIIQVAAGVHHTVGLRSDGTVMAVGDNEYGQCDVGGWTNIVRVAAGYDHTVGLKSDGTVVAVGNDYYGQCRVGGWTDIVQVAAGVTHTVGLKSDGTVVAVGPPPGSEYDFRQCNVADWTDIVQVAAGGVHTVGLKADGTVVAVGPPPGSEYDHGQCDVGDWMDIVQVSAGHFHTVGVKSDGTVVAVGPPPGSEYDYGQCAVHGWNLGG